VRARFHNSAFGSNHLRSRKVTGNSAKALGGDDKEFCGISASLAQVSPIDPAPKQLSGGFVFIEENKDRAEEQAMKWIAEQYRTMIKHSVSK
jgi:hypothetical protein